MKDLKQQLQGDNEKRKGIDKKIIEKLEKTLSDMSEQAEDIDEKTQIVDRMLNLNVLFSNFDEQIAILRSIQNEKEQDDTKEQEK